MTKTSSSEGTSQKNLKGEERMAVRERTGVSLIDLWEAGRYRAAQVAAKDVRPDSAENILGLAVVEITRDNLSAAKDYLTPLAFGSDALAGRAKSTLAYAYYLAGEVNEAKDLLRDTPDSFYKHLLKAIIETRPKYALKILNKCTGFEVRPGLAGRLHNQRAIALRRLRKLDESIQEYEAALYFFELDQSDCVALVMNNLARVYLEYGELDRAHEQVDKAIALLQDDLPHLGKALDEKSRIFIAERNFKAARIKSEQAASILRKCDRKEWLVEALLTYAQVLRGEHDEREFTVLQEASEVCRFAQRNDLLIDVLKRRHELSVIVSVESESLLLRTALEACGGSLRGAATKLNTTHWRVMRLMKKHGLSEKKSASNLDR